MNDTKKETGATQTSKTTAAGFRVQTGVRAAGEKIKIYYEVKLQDCLVSS